MNEAFEKLLEAELDGTLTQAQREQLDALCARDEACAARRRSELQVAALLRGRGPARAPQGLARRVFEQMDASSKKSTGGLSWLWPAPATVRWVGATAVLCLVLVEVGVLVRQNMVPIPSRSVPSKLLVSKAERELAVVPAPLEESAPTDHIAMKTEEVASDGDFNFIYSKDVDLLSAVKDDVNSASQITWSFMVAEDKLGQDEAQSAPLPTQTPAEQSEVVLAMAPTPKASSEQPGVGGGVTTFFDQAKDQAETAADAKSEEAATLEQTTVAAKAEANAEPAPEPFPKELAMTVTLVASNTKPASTAEPLVIPSGMLKSLTGNDKVNGNGVHSLSPGGEKKGINRSLQSGPSLRDVEIALATCGGEILKRKQLKSPAGATQLECELPTEQLGALLESLNKLGLTQGAVGAPPVGQPVYVVEQGSRLLDTIQIKSADGKESKSKLSWRERRSVPKKIKIRLTVRTTSAP